MKQLFATSYQLIERTSTVFVRYLYNEIRWGNRLIAITGARGSGKTTLMLQYIKEHYTAYSNEALYASLDNIWFFRHSLLELADEFHKMGGKTLFLDEVHKYPTWSVEIKNIYDSYPDMKVVFTGSSLLEIHKGEADLSRRAVIYHLHGLSFREFLMFEYGHKVETVTLSDILTRHVEIAMNVGKVIKPLVAFKEYLSYGYYPFYKEDKVLYHEKLLATLNIILDVDLPSTEKIDYYSIGKMKKLFADATGGEVGFKSKANIGSEFWYIGYTDVEYVEKSEVADEDLNNKSTEHLSADSPVKIKNLNILIAEDNDSNYLLIKKLLKDNQLTRAITGVEAIEKIKAQTFDIVFMDMRMPVMNGLEATSLIREFNQTTPIIALTANAFDSDRENALAAGCNHFMTKPVKKRELMDLLFRYFKQQPQ